ncbi:hypothetical protein TCDM_07021 [Trypanosoma cruzi Dm28c]|uniref:Uncharacterized protein n=1 Tax=Trypanosoma cruzi Dm28c TaxID=1416333 RepID=V5BJZ9_TRYCR|nr:hypothetical protein TCDM_07021 [Trypanosoma cruzi Dm28c]
MFYFCFVCFVLFIFVLFYFVLFCFVLFYFVLFCFICLFCVFGLFKFTRYVQSAFPFKFWWNIPVILMLFLVFSLNERF